jgi:membrane protein DedA with SNARE-associated domain
MMLFGILVGLIGSGLNYYFGCFLSKKLHDGKAQRFMNWYLPTIARRSSPNNSIKYFY